jgi:hypothetical protein
MMMAQLVQYIGQADAFTPKQKTDRMNQICDAMQADGYRLVTAIPDIGGEGHNGRYLAVLRSSRRGSKQHPRLPGRPCLRSRL